MLWLAALLLAIEPAIWLFRSWTAPAWDSDGWLVAALVLGLLLFSLSSGRLNMQGGRRQSRRNMALWLLFLAASLRLAGQLTGIRILGASTLILDVYVLACLADTGNRRRAVSPFWLAMLFGLTLPLEQILQRVGGYVLQELSAAGACALLSLSPWSVSCDGVLLTLAGQTLSVDLPCSGARGLILLLTLFVTLAALGRPRPGRALAGLGFALLSAFGTNLLRLLFLALGGRIPPELGINVMEQPWHDLTGLLALGLGAIPLLIWFHWLPRSQRAQRSPRSQRSQRAASSTGPEPAGQGGESLQSVSGLSLHRFSRPVAALFAGLALCGLAVALPFIPASPVGQGSPLPAPDLPWNLAGMPGRDLPLSEEEDLYFSQYGGAAARRAYGPHTLLVVTSDAPLRHLHSPEVCLRGAGHRVLMLGSRRIRINGEEIPSALFRSIGPDGRAWRVEVSWRSSHGEMAGSAAEVTWRWLQAPSRRWTMIQRISPWDADDLTRQSWDLAVLRASDLPPARNHRPGLTVHVDAHPVLAYRDPVPLSGPRSRIAQ